MALVAIRAFRGMRRFIGVLIALIVMMLIFTFTQNRFPTGTNPKLIPPIDIHPVHGVDREHVRSDRGSGTADVPTAVLDPLTPDRFHVSRLNGKGLDWLLH
jgi:hypothetical protein